MPSSSPLRSSIPKGDLRTNSTVVYQGVLVLPCLVYFAYQMRCQLGNRTQVKVKPQRTPLESKSVALRSRRIGFQLTFHLCIYGGLVRVVSRSSVQVGSGSVGWVDECDERMQRDCVRAARSCERGLHRQMIRSERCGQVYTESRIHALVLPLVYVYRVGCTG